MGKLIRSVGQVIRAKVELATHAPDDPEALRQENRRLRKSIECWWRFYLRATDADPKLAEWPEAAVTAMDRVEAR